MKMRENPIEHILDAAKQRPYKNCSIYYGIVDNNGIESMFKLGENISTSLRSLDLRCRYNTHRNARIFTCLIKDNVIPSKNSKMLYELLKERSIIFKD